MNSPLAHLLMRWLVLALGVVIATHLIPGIHCSDVGALIAVVVLMSFFNAILRPILVLFTLPFIIVTMGLGIVVINAILFLFVGRLVDGFTVTGFWPADPGAVHVAVHHRNDGAWYSRYQCHPVPVCRAPRGWIHGHGILAGRGRLPGPERYQLRRELGHALDGGAPGGAPAGAAALDRKSTRLN